MLLKMRGKGMEEIKCGESNMCELEFSACADQLSFIRAATAAEANKAGFCQDVIDNITLAITEAFTNIIRHGYKECCEGQKVILKMEQLKSPDGLKIVLRDFGRQVEPCEICGRDLDDIRPGGLGVHIIKSLMSSVKYEKADGEGMMLTMVRYR